VGPARADPCRAALIEREVAAQAADLATRKQIAAIEESLAAMEEEAADGNVPLKSDRAFHIAVAEAAGNGVLVELVQRFWWMPATASCSSSLAPTSNRRARGLAAIEGIVRCWSPSASTMPKAARQAMQHHMDKAHARFSASWRRAKRAD